MTSPTNELTAGSDVPAIAAVVRQAAIPQELDLGSLYVVHRGDGGIEQIDLTSDAYREQPARIEGTVQLTHVDSLLSYWDKHHDGSSEVYADRERHTITTVLDANHGWQAEDESERDEEERARWCRHRAVLTLTMSDTMRQWLARDGKPMGQEDFAEFLEDHMADITDPDGATLLEMAQAFQATTHAQFKSGFHIQNGQRILSYVETVDGRMSDGQTAVPTRLDLRVPVWRGAYTAVEMTARLRYRVPGGKLTFSYHLDRPTEVVDAAFEAEIARIAEHVERPVLRGTPAGAR